MLLNPEQFFRGHRPLTRFGIGNPVSPEMRMSFTPLTAYATAGTRCVAASTSARGRPSQSDVSRKRIRRGGQGGRIAPPAQKMDMVFDIQRDGQRFCLRSKRAIAHNGQMNFRILRHERLRGADQIQRIFLRLKIPHAR